MNNNLYSFDDVKEFGIVKFDLINQHYAIDRCRPQEEVDQLFGKDSYQLFQLRSIQTGKIFKFVCIRAKVTLNTGLYIVKTTCVPIDSKELFDSEIAIEVAMDLIKQL